jgi:hypothetical protein
MRSDKGTRVIFGDTKRSIRAKSSIYSTEDLKTYTAQHTIQAPIGLPPITGERKSSKNVQVSETTSIPARKGKLIDVKINWPENLKEAFMEKFTILPHNINVLEAIISTETKQIIVFNTGEEDVILEPGTQLGKLLNPERSLDKSTPE